MTIIFQQVPRGFDDESVADMMAKLKNQAMCFLIVSKWRGCRYEIDSSLEQLIDGTCVYQLVLSEVQ